MSQFISRPTSKPSDGFCFHNEHCSEKHSTEGREESSTIRKSESYRTVESTHLDINGNDIFAQLSFGDNECENIDYNYDDLSVCPKVTSLFKASEAELEHAIFAKSSSDIGISTDDEDDIKTELDRLADVEQQLRDELEMSNMGFSFYLDRNEEAGIVHEATPGTNNNYRGLQGISANDSGGSEGIVKDNTMTEKLAGERIFPLHDDSNVVRKQPEQPNKTTNTNIKTKQEEEGSNQQTHKGSGSNYKIYTLYDHADQIGLIYDDSDLGYPTCPLFSSDSGIIHDSNLGNSGDERTREDKIVEFLKCARDYVKPMTSASLSRIYVGLVGDNHSCTIANEKDDIAAVRTVAIQIRPDASVDEVMSTFNSSLKSMNGTVTNLQMGHLRALLPGRWVQESEYVPFRTTQKKADVTISSRRGMVFLPPIAIDAQLCTRKKSTFVERVLLIRSYSIQLPILDDGCSSLTPVNNSQNSNLRESASLHQRMRKVATVGGNISFNFKGDLEEDNNFMVDNCTLDTRKRRVKSHKRFGFLHQASHKNESDVSQKRSQKRKPVSVRFDTCGSIESVRGQNDPKTLASEQLLSTFTDSPSILDSANDVDASIPALSHLDWPYIQSTWRILIASMTELEKRGLSQRYIKCNILCDSLCVFKCLLPFFYSVVLYSPAHLVPFHHILLLIFITALR
jgi:hypothetical protein